MQTRRRELRFEYRPPKVRQHLTDEQKQVRTECCEFMLEKRESFSSIVFSDESRFCRGLFTHSRTEARWVGDKKHRVLVITGG